MAGGKIHHWKHGWIPLDNYARAIVAGKSKKEALLGPMNTDVLLKEVKEQGGFTFDAKKNSLIHVGDTKGFVVARPGTEEIVGHGSVGREEFAQGFANVIEKHYDEIAGGAKIGGWYSSDRDAYMVELSDIYTDRDTAIKAAQKGHQEALFDIGSGEEIPTPTLPKPNKKDTLGYTSVSVDGIQFKEHGPLGYVGSSASWRDRGEPTKRDEQNSMIMDDLTEMFGTGEWGIGAGPKDVYNFSPDEKHDITTTVREVFDQFPKAEPPKIYGVDLGDNPDDTDAMGVTRQDGKSVYFPKQMFDPYYMETVRANWGAHGVIAAGQPTVADMRRTIIAHELVHSLHLQNSEVEAKLLRFAEKKYSTEWGMPGVYPRYEMDNLDGKSEYCNTSPYEWIAEAGADALINGSTMSDAANYTMIYLKGAYGK